MKGILLKYDDKTKEEIRKIYNVTEETIQRDLEILRTWLKQQPHLPQEMPYKNFLEHILLGRKFNVERTKQCLEKLFTFKTYNSELFDCFNDGIPPRISEDHVLGVPLPNLGPVKERIYIYYADSANTFKPEEFIKNSIALGYFNYKFDYNTGFRIIIDCKTLTLEFIKNLPIAAVIKLFNLILNAFPARVTGIEMLNMKPFLSIIANLFTMVTPKIRIRYHNNLESLLKEVPLEYLPEEYGGKNGSLKEQIELCDKLLAEEYENIVKFAALKTNESLRVGEIIRPSEMYGVEGTFKKLSVD